MSINQLSATALQSIFRRLLNLDIESKNRLHEFENKLIHIRIDDFQLEYYFRVKNAELTVEQHFDNKIDGHPALSLVSISGQLSAFIAAAAAEHSADAIFEGNLKFSGDIATAKQFQSFVQSLNIDWQEPLARIFGDPIGHTLTTGLEKISGWLKNTAKTVRQDISEYVQEEARVTPSRYEQQHFFQQVDQIRSKTDRLIAKMNRLKAIQLESTQSSSTNHSDKSQ